MRNALLIGSLSLFLFVSTSAADGQMGTLYAAQEEELNFDPNNNLGLEKHGFYFSSLIDCGQIYIDDKMRHLQRGRANLRVQGCFLDEAHNHKVLVVTFYHDLGPVFIKEPLLIIFADAQDPDDANGDGNWEHEMQSALINENAARRARFNDEWIEMSSKISIISFFLRNAGDVFERLARNGTNVLRD